jgi:hypothetical protein
MVNTVENGIGPPLMEYRRRSAGYVMVLGLLVAVAMYAVACGRYYVSTRRLATFQRQCLELLQQRPPRQRRVSGPGWVVERPDLKKLCALPSYDTPADFVLDDDPINGFEWPSGDDIRASIKNVHQKRRTDWDNIRWWALVIGLLSSIPRVWYFLLGRIVELSAAIKGG